MVMELMRVFVTFPKFELSSTVNDRFENVRMLRRMTKSTFEILV
jgi:hypothetical protein